MRYSVLVVALVVAFISCQTKPTETKTENASETENYEIFIAPDTSKLKNDDWGILVKYGKNLIHNTAYYIGPDGVASHNLHNKMNCTNCHLDDGTRPFGLNFFDTHKTYPQYRARENQVLSLADRVNNCIERPHSGDPLALDSKEMLAIIAYIKWLGEEYDKNKHEGYSLKYVKYQGLAANSSKGEQVYNAHCKTCHQADGQGQFNTEKTSYIYPPLWGPLSYQEGSSMHRVIKAASFIKYNMPHLIARWDKPVLSDQEALDVAAFINDANLHARPKSKYVCYPNISTKPIDYFKGPYEDGFSEYIHAFGPWDEVEKYYVDKGLKVHK